MLEQFSPI